MSINEFIYFYSSKSPKSMECLKYLISNKIPINPIKLDTAKDRSIAKNGKYFQIVAVPSLVIIFGDGNLQLLVGQQKIVLYIKNLITSMRQQAMIDESNQHQPHETQEDYPTSIDYPSTNHSPKTKTSRRKKKSSRKKKPKSSSKSSKSSSSSSSSSSKPIDFTNDEEDDSDEIVFIEEDDKPSRKPIQYSMNKKGNGTKGNDKPSRMNDLIEAAKQMQKDRKSTLGYDEDNLPKF